MHVLLLWWWRGRGGDGGESNLLQTGGTSWGNQNAVLHSPRVRLRDCRTSAFCDTQSLIHQLFLLLLLLLLLFPHLPWCNGHGWLGVKKQFSSFLPSPLPPPPPNSHSCGAQWLTAANIFSVIFFFCQSETKEIWLTESLLLSLTSIKYANNRPLVNGHISQLWIIVERELFSEMMF